MFALELEPGFVLGEGIPLEAEDLRYGFEHCFLKPLSVVELASSEVARGAADPVLVELAALLSDEVDKVAVVFQLLDDPERIHDPRTSKRKWLYLQLKATFYARDRLADPLAVVEQIYADFCYPHAIESFVRYMPLRLVLQRHFVIM
jgi:hypothetical protein